MNGGQNASGAGVVLNIWLLLLKPLSAQQECHYVVGISYEIQEAKMFNDLTSEMFLGIPIVENGNQHNYKAPGLGIDTDDKLAKHTLLWCMIIIIHK